MFTLRPCLTLTPSHSLTLTPSRVFQTQTHSQLYLLCESRRPWKPGSQLERPALLPGSASFWSPRALVTSGVSRREVGPPPREPHLAFVSAVAQVPR